LPVVSVRGILVSVAGCKWMGNLLEHKNSSHL
jgi:hypothetical protein